MRWKQVTLFDLGQKSQSGSSHRPSTCRHTSRELGARHGGFAKPPQQILIYLNFHLADRLIVPSQN
jgi:hypothetical protein